ncbi:MAG: FAD-binding oxidoreductase [Oligoflexus sp.]
MNPYEIYYRNSRMSLLPGETVLAALERQGHQQPASCRAGVCQSCVMKVVEGAVPAAAQAGLKASWKEQGYFLPCVCKPNSSLQIVDVAAFGEPKNVSLIESVTLGVDVKLFRFQRPRDFHFHAGQFLSFRRDDGLMRTYSIASLPAEKDFFDIHVRRVAGGQMSAWLHDEALPGTSLQVTGPKGDCYYQSDTGEETLILLGLGTGIAPLYAITQQALREKHQGPIQVIQGSTTSERLYLLANWRGLVQEHENLSYRNSVLHPTAGDDEDTVVGDIGQLMSEVIAAAKNHRLYLCGDAAIVQRLKKQAFLAGVSMKHIFADPFI